MPKNIREPANATRSVTFPLEAFPESVRYKLVQKYILDLGITLDSKEIEELEAKFYPLKKAMEQYDRTCPFCHLMLNKRDTWDDHASQCRAIWLIKKALQNEPK